MLAIPLRCAGELVYRTGLGPQPSDEPDQGLVEAVEGAGGLAPGPAPVRAAVGRGWLVARRYELRRR